MAHLLQLVAHLCYWGKAAIIDTITLTSAYGVAPNAPIHRESPQANTFSQRFGVHTLPWVSAVLGGMMNYRAPSGEMGQVIICESTQARWQK